MKKNYQQKIKKRLQKLSSVDILAIFAIFFITATIYFFFSRKTEYLDVTIRLFNDDHPEYQLDNNQPKSWYIQQIKTGKAQKNQLGETLIEIADVYSYPNPTVYSDVYVTLKLKAIQNRITKQYVYEGNPLLIHDIRSFKIQDLLVTGEIIDLTQEKRELQKFRVSFKLDQKRPAYDYQNTSEALIKGVENYVAEMMEADLTIKDSEGENIVKVINVKKTQGERVLATQQGLFHLPDIDRTQVTLELEMLAEKINGQYYYRKEEPLIVDEKIYLTFDQITVQGVITSLEAIP